MPPSEIELLFLYDDTPVSENRQASAQAVVDEEEWRRGFRKRLFDSISWFNNKPMTNRTRIHCADFKQMVTTSEVYAVEVRKLSLTALQLLAVLFCTGMLRSDLPYFKAEYVNLFVMREELRGRTNDEVDKKLRNTRGAGGDFFKIYKEIKSRKFEVLWCKSMPNNLTPRLSRSTAVPCSCWEPGLWIATTADISFK